MKKWIARHAPRWALFVLAALMPLAGAAQMAPDWTAAAPGTYGDMIAVDKDNNAYVVGSVPWSTISIAKYSAAGALLWQRAFDNPGTREQGSWVALDPAGNALIAGYVVAGASNDPNGLVVLKYDPAGNLLWQDVIPSAFGYALRAASDAAGNVFVLGRAWLANASGNTTHDIVTIKYSPNGTRQWVRSLGFDATSADSPASMAVTKTGNVIVTGGSTAGMLMAAYDPAGNQLWSKTVPASTGATDVALGPNGEFIVVGGTYSAAAGNAILAIKHDANFNEVWRRSYAAGQYGRRVAIDSGGNAIVAGVAGNYLDWMTLKLDPNGAVLWSRRYDQHQYNDEIPYAIVLGPDGAAYITGQGGPGPTSGSLSYLRTVTVKYAADGTQVWAASTFDSVRGLGVALGSDNSVLVVGESPLTVLHYKQAGAANQPPTAIAAASKTSGTAPLSVSFSSAGSTDPDGTIVRLQWNFGDGATSLEANPTHVYAAGTWTATLAVTDNLGATSTSAPLAITASPAPSTASPPQPTAITFDRAFVIGGRDTAATVTVSGSAGVVVALASSEPAVAAVPQSVTIPAGATSATFKVRTSRVKTSHAVTITATANQASASATLTVAPR